MNRPTKDDLDKMENDVVAFYEISCGDALDNFDIIINCNSTKEIRDVLKKTGKKCMEIREKRTTRSSSKTSPN